MTPDPSSGGMFGRVRRLFGASAAAPPEPPPAWANCFQSADQVRRFENAVKIHFAGRGILVAVNDGMARRADAAPDDHGMGLSNVGQLCALEPEAHWPSIIAHHFDMLERTRALSSIGPDDQATFASVADQLVLRLWEEQHVDEIARLSVTRAEIPGLLTVLSLDLPEAVRTITRTETAGWGISEHELFARAEANVRRLSPVEVQELDVGEGPPIRAYAGDSYYVASLARHPEELDGALGVHGALIGAPARNVLFALPFDGLVAMASLGPLAALTVAAARRGPGTISHRIWWYRASRWLEIPFQLPTRKAEALAIMPPDEFTEYLNTLA